MRAVAARLTLSISLLTGCSGLTLPGDPPDVEGTVILWDVPFPGESEFFLRLAVTDQGCVHRTLIADDTDLALRQPGGSLTAATFKDLEMGQTIRVWTREPVTSCPGNSTARAAEILP